MQATAIRVSWMVSMCYGNRPAVSKSGAGQPVEGSNPLPSAFKCCKVFLGCYLRQSRLRVPCLRLSAWLGSHKLLSSCKLLVTRGDGLL